MIRFTFGTRRLPLVLDRAVGPEVPHLWIPTSCQGCLFADSHIVHLNDNDLPEAWEDRLARLKCAAINQLLAQRGGLASKIANAQRDLGGAYAISPGFLEFLGRVEGRGIREAFHPGQVKGLLEELGERVSPEDLRALENLLLSLVIDPDHQRSSRTRCAIFLLHMCVCVYLFTTVPHPHGHGHPQ